MFQTEEPGDPFQPIRFRWGAADLVAFAFFFLTTVIFFPLAAITVMRIFRPSLRVADLTAVDQVVLQGLMDVVLVAFIMFLVKVVRGLRFLETIHCYRQHPFSTRS